MYIKHSVDEKLLLSLEFSVALFAGCRASMFEQPGQANSRLISSWHRSCVVCLLDALLEKDPGAPLPLRVPHTREAMRRGGKSFGKFSG